MTTLDIIVNIEKQSTCTYTLYIHYKSNTFAIAVNNNITIWRAVYTTISSIDKDKIAPSEE